MFSIETQPYILYFEGFLSFLKLNRIYLWKWLKFQQLTEDVIKHHTRMPILFVFLKKNSVE